jgi:activator of HSP90 ATPase
VTQEETTMATETIHASTVLAASPKAIYDAWLDGDAHAAMTGGGATGEPRVGTAFTAWDDYITGTHLELQPARRIVQAWRSTQFPASAGNSRVIVVLDAEGAGTRITIVHTDIPTGQGASYESGWEKHYFGPMRAYFAKPAKKKATPKKKAAAKKKATSKRKH